MKVVLLKDWTVEDAENGIIGDIMKIEIKERKVIVTMTMMEDLTAACHDAGARQMEMDCGIC